MYLLDLPAGSHADEARAAIVRLAYLNAAGEDSIEAYERFLEEYTDSRYAMGAKARLTHLRIQDQAN